MTVQDFNVTLDTLTASPSGSGCRSGSRPRKKELHVLTLWPSCLPPSNRKPYLAAPPSNQTRARSPPAGNSAEWRRDARRGFHIHRARLRSPSGRARGSRYAPRRGPARQDDVPPCVLLASGHVSTFTRGKLNRLLAPLSGMHQMMARH